MGILASGSSSGGGSGLPVFTCGLSVQGIAPVSDGTVWAGVFAKTNTGTEDRVVLFDSDGSEQLNYVIGTGGDDNAIRAVALATDGNTDVYVGGDFSEGILRLKADGTLDAAFNVGTGFNGRVTSIVPLTSGEVYVGGFFTEFNGNMIPASGLVRLNADGSSDISEFNAIGVTDVEAVALATDAPSMGSVYTGGSNLNPAERWSSGGAQDASFNPTFSPVFSVMPADDGFDNIYFGGGFAKRIIRVNTNGNNDAGFDVGVGFDDNVMSIDRGVAGDIDVNFDVGSGFGDPNDLFPSSTVAGVAQTTDGSTDVLVGGGFTQYKGVAVNGIVRLNIDGSIDNAFDVSIAIDGDTCDSQSIPDS